MGGCKPLAGETKILILEILQCIHVVKILAFLELEQIFSFVDGHYFVGVTPRTSYGSNNRYQERD